MSKARAFLNGIREFRSDWTTHYNAALIVYYDWGRELAHRLTLRKFEHV